MAGADPHGRTTSCRQACDPRKDFTRHLVQLRSEQQERPGPAARRSPTDIPGLPGGTAVNTEDDMKRFVSQVLADTEDVWHGVFRFDAE